MFAGVHRAKMEVFAPINPEVTFVPVTRSMPDTDARQVCRYVCSNWAIEAKQFNNV